MRILIFLPCFTYGGAEKQAAILACHLSDLGYEVEAWGFPAPNATEPLKVELECRGVKCRVLPAWPRLDWRGMASSDSQNTFSLNRIRWGAQLFWQKIQLPKGKYDVVVPFTFWPSLVSALLRDQLGASILVWNHRGSYDDSGVSYSPFLVDQIVKAAPVFVANSSAGCSFLCEKFLLPPGAVKLVRNAFVPWETRFGSLRRLTVQQPQTFNLLHTANFFPEKDFETLLQAMRLLKLADIPCHLHLAGEFQSNAQKSRFLHYLQQMEVSSIVTLHGYVDPPGIASLLDQADIGILSSKSEGCPNCVMEYMYHGLPVVGTDIPGIRDLVGDEGIPYLFRVGNAFQMKCSIEILANDPGLRYRLGKANQKRITELFTPEQVFACWMDVLFPFEKSKSVL